MTVEECNTALYEKLFESQEKLRGWLLSQPPEEILNHAYEYTMREDILLSLEYNDLTARQAQALLALVDPLDELFHHMEQRESGQMEFVLRCMEEKGDELIAAEDAATSQIPVYLQSAAHAVEHGSWQNTGRPWTRISPAKTPWKRRSIPITKTMPWTRTAPSGRR